MKTKVFKNPKNRKCQIVTHNKSQFLSKQAGIIGSCRMFLKAFNNIPEKDEIDMSERPEMKREIPFSPPDISQAEIDEVVDTLRSGWITTGP